MSLDVISTMGNVVSAMLMYALQAAWWCQRLLDQDFRQNHGSRLCPIPDYKAEEIDVLLPDVTTAILARSPHHRSKLARKRTIDPADGETRTRRRTASFRTHNVTVKELKRTAARQEEQERAEESAMSSSACARLVEGVDPEYDAHRNTWRYVTQVQRQAGLRRAFSESSIRTNENQVRTLTLVGAQQPSELSLYSIV